MDGKWTERAEQESVDLINEEEVPVEDDRLSAGFNLRLMPDEHAALKAAAEKELLSMNTYVRRLIRNAINAD